MINYKLLCLIILIIIADTIALASITKYSKNYQIIYFIIAFILYGIVVPYCLSIALQYSGIGTINFIGNIFSTVLLILIGYFFFGENMNKLKALAFITGTLSLILLYISEL